MLKKIALIGLIVLVLPSFIFAGELYPRQNDKGKWGYVDETGNKVIDYKYAEAYPFENGIAKVKKGSLYGYISPSGKEVIKIKYSQIQPWKDNRSKVAVGGSVKDGVLVGAKWGYISSDGSVLLKPEYDKIGDFENGLAYIQKNGKYGYINNHLDIVLKCEYSGVGEFNPEGVCWIAKGGSLKNNTLQGAKYGIADNTGRILIEPKYKHIGTFTRHIPEANPILCNLVNNETGQKRIKAAIKSSQKGMAAKMLGAGFTNSTQDALDELKRKTASAVAAFQAEITKDLDEQEAQLYKECPTWDLIGYEFIEEKPFSELNMTYSPYLAVSNSNIVSDNSSWLITAKLNDKIGIVDKTGTIILKPGTYGLAFLPSDGFIPVAKKKGSGFEINYVKNDGRLLLKKWVPALNVTPFVNNKAVISGIDGQYIINNSGTVISENYSLILPSTNDRHIVKRNGKYGLIDNNGGQIVAPTWNVIMPENSGLYCAQKNPGGKYGYLGLDGEYAVEPTFTMARSFVNGSATAKTDNGWGVIDRNNTTLVDFEWDDAMPVSPFNPNVCWVNKNGLWQGLSLVNFKKAFYGMYHGVTNFDQDGHAHIQNADGLYGCIDAQGNVIIPMRLASSDLVGKCLIYLNDTGKKSISEIEAHRFNLKNNPESNSFRLSHSIKNSMWEF